MNRVPPEVEKDLETFILRVWDPKQKKWLSDKEIRKIWNFNDDSVFYPLDGKDYLLKRDDIGYYAELIND